MKWGASTVAHFVAEAGFTRPDLHTATAIAMAGTNGIDHYDVAVGIPGSGRYVGLWAINVDEWPEYRADWLLEPHNAAKAAYDLTRRNAGFGWSAVWRNGCDRHWLTQAAVAHSLEPFREVTSAPIRSLVARRQIDTLGPRLERYKRNG